MIILRQKSYAELQESKEKSSHAIPLAVGGTLAAGTAGTTYLSKKVKDNRAKHQHDLQKHEINRNFKQNQRNLVKQRRARINGVNFDIDRDIRSAENKVRMEKDFLNKIGKGSVNGSSSSDLSLFKLNFVTRNGKTISAGYDNTVNISSVTKNGETNVNVKGLDEAKRAMNNSRKDFINVEKAAALNKNDELKMIKNSSHKLNNINLNKKLLKNKKVAKAGYVAAPVVGLAGYAAARKLQNNKKNK